MKKTTKKKQTKKTHETYTYEEIKQNKTKHKKILRHIKKHGKHTLAYSTLQPGMNYHIQKEGIIAYKKNKKQNKTYILGDPMLEKGSEKKFIRKFLKEHPNTIVVQCTEKYAKFFEKEGFYINSLGVEYHLDVQEFKVSYNTRKGLKEWCRVQQKEGVEVLEIKENKELAELAVITPEWVSSKKTKKELTFLTRPFMHEDEEEEIRVFVAKKDGKIIAFCTFEPSFENKKITHYSVNHMRHIQEAQKGVIGYIITEAISQFKNEGINKVSIGLAPLHKRDDTKFKSSKFTSWISDKIYRYANKLYNFKHLGENKERYKGNEVQTYLAFKKKYPLGEIMELFRVIGIIN